jgi:pulcherriminic acid synthase
MSNDTAFAEVLDRALDLDEALGGGASGAKKDFPLMPYGQACDMGTAPDGTPLIDPRIFDSYEFVRNPYPYYRIMRDHYPVFHDKLHNCYYVTRYDDITECYFDDEGFNTIPKGSSSGVLGNTQLELSGVEHRRRRNLYGQHLVGQSLNARIPAIERLAAEMVSGWDTMMLKDSAPDSMNKAIR